LDGAIAEHERQRLEMARVERLYEGRDSNAKELYDTRANLRVAEEEMNAARASYDLGVAGPRREEIARAAHEVAAQQAIVERLESDLEKMSIRAPFSGPITERKVEVGEWISVGGEIAELIDLGSVLVRVDVPESAFFYVRPEQPVRVKLDALKESVTGRIRHIIRQANPQARTFPIEIEIDNSKGRLAAGMFARATVPAGPDEKVVAVPKDSIVQREGVSYIATTMPGQQGGMMGMLMGVTVGADVEDWIAITSGNVRPGMTVITRGNEQIMPFPTPVQIVDERGTPIAMPEGGTPQEAPGGA